MAWASKTAAPGQEAGTPRSPAAGDRGTAECTVFCASLCRLGPRRAALTPLGVRPGLQWAAPCRKWLPWDRARSPLTGRSQARGEPACLGRWAGPAWVTPALRSSLPAGQDTRLSPLSGGRAFEAGRSPASSHDRPAVLPEAHEEPGPSTARSLPEVRGTALWDAGRGASLPMRSGHVGFGRDLLGATEVLSASQVGEVNGTVYMLCSPSVVFWKSWVRD